MDHNSRPTIPISRDEYSEASKHLSPEECEKIVHASSLDPPQQEYMPWHQRLGHLPKRAMMILLKHGILPQRFIHMEEEDRILTCASY
eukprot:1850077-Ditylum_brightwellii.AAC.1